MRVFQLLVDGSCNAGKNRANFTAAGCYDDVVNAFFLRQRDIEKDVAAVLRNPGVFFYVNFKVFSSML